MNSNRSGYLECLHRGIFINKIIKIVSQIFGFYKKLPLLLKIILWLAVLSFALFLRYIDPDKTDLDIYMILTVFKTSEYLQQCLQKSPVYLICNFANFNEICAGGKIPPLVAGMRVNVTCLMYPF